MLVSIGVRALVWCEEFALAMDIFVEESWVLVEARALVGV